jgi:hypothetical protein
MPGTATEYSLAGTDTVAENTSGYQNLAESYGPNTFS